MLEVYYLTDISKALSLNSQQSFIGGLVHYC